MPRHTPAPTGPPVAEATVGGGVGRAVGGAVGRAVGGAVGRAVSGAVERAMGGAVVGRMTGGRLAEVPMATSEHP